MRPARPLAWIATLAALTASTATALPLSAQAEPPINVNTDSGNGAVNESATSCSPASTVTGETNNVQVVPNGPAVSRSATSVGTMTNNNDSTDTISFSTSITGTAKVTTAGPNPGSFDLQATGRAGATTSNPKSACYLRAFSYFDVEGGFIVHDPGFLVYDVEGAAQSYVELYVEDGAGHPVEISAGGRKLDSTGSVFLEPGEYVFYGEIDAWLLTTTSRPSAGFSAKVHAEFAIAGSRSAGPKGKAKPYVKFPRFRTCATDTVDLKVKAGRAAKVKSVSFLLNGRRLKTLVSPSAADRARLKVKDGVPATVVAKVTLKPTRPGARPRKVEAAASYLACS